MRVAELTARREFRLREAELSAPAAGEVQVRVEAVGVCGSDLHSYAEGGVGDTLCRYPMVLGHEPAGTVVRVGEGVAGWAPGDHAALEPALYCYHCEFCRAGRHNICAHIRFMSMPGEPGFFREYVNLPAANLLPIPPRMSFALATVAEPLAVVLHSMQFAAVKQGETAAVFGAGPIGLLTVACLKLAGAGHIWCVEPVAHRRELALHMGADAALDPAQIDPAAAILRDTAQRGVDLAIDCAAKDNTVNQSIHVARNGGRVVVTGIPTPLQVPLDFSPMRRKELVLYNVRRSAHETPAAIELLATHGAMFEGMLTHTRGLDGIAEAFDIAEHYRDGVGKMIVAPR